MRLFHICPAKYSPKAGKKVKRAMHEMKRGQLKTAAQVNREKPQASHSGRFFNWPRFISCMARLTFLPAFGEYLRGIYEIDAYNGQRLRIAGDNHSVLGHLLVYNCDQ